MKILSDWDGVTRPWWLGMKINCCHCDLEIELEDSDRRGNPDVVVDGLTVDLRCPRCEAGNTIVLQSSIR